MATDESIAEKIEFYKNFGNFINYLFHVIIICDRIWEKGPYRANNDFSV